MKTLTIICFCIALVFGLTIPKLEKRLDGEALAAGAIGGTAAAVMTSPFSAIPPAVAVTAWGLTKLEHHHRCGKKKTEDSCNQLKYCIFIADVGCTYTED
jgi:hypothetical protein